MMMMYKQCVQKMLFVHSIQTAQKPIRSLRGMERFVEAASAMRWVSKSHGIHRVEAMQRVFADANYITCLRDSKQSMSSYISLRDACLQMFSGVSLFDDKCTAVLTEQIAWDVRYYRREQMVLQTNETRLVSTSNNIRLAPRTDKKKSTTSTKAGKDNTNKSSSSDSKSNNINNDNEKTMRWLAVKYVDVTRNLVPTINALFAAVEPAVVINQQGIDALQTEDQHQTNYVSSHQHDDIFKKANYANDKFASDFGAYGKFVTALSNDADR
jgi:hypothetical protein